MVGIHTINLVFDIRPCYKWKANKFSVLLRLRTQRSAKMVYQVHSSNWQEPLGHSVEQHDILWLLKRRGDFRKAHSCFSYFLRIWNTPRVFYEDKPNMTLDVLQTDKGWGGKKGRNPVLGIWFCVDFRRLNMTPQVSLRKTATLYRRVLWICWEKATTHWLPQSSPVSKPLFQSLLGASRCLLSQLPKHDRMFWNFWIGKDNPKSFGVKATL